MSSKSNAKTPQKLLFRDLALALPETAESKHMGHPDFRVGGKIFATLSANETSGVVKLTPEQQAVFVRSEPAVYKPLNGAWGRRGWTRVELAAATEPSLHQALVQAWRNMAPPKLAKEFADLQVVDPTRT